MLSKGYPDLTQGEILRHQALTRPMPQDDGVNSGTMTRPTAQDDGINSGTLTRPTAPNEHARKVAIETRASHILQLLMPLTESGTTATLYPVTLDEQGHVVTALRQACLP